MDDPNITMEEYIRLEEEKARRHGKVYNWETATYGKIWYDEDVHDLRSVETEFLAIAFSDALTSEVALSSEPTVSLVNDNKIDFRISFDESDDEDYTVIYDKNSFSYKIIYVNDLKTDSENDNDKVNMPSFPSSKPTMIKYAFGDDEEYVAIKEDEYDDLTSTRKDACRAYQEIVRMMDEGWMIQEKVFAIAALKNELMKLKGNSIDTKFAKTLVLEKRVLQSLINQSSVRQPNAFKSDRPQISKSRFASQIDVKNDLSKPVTQHYLPKGKEYDFAKPNHMIASSSSRNSSKNMPRFSSNDMVHDHYLEAAKKKTQERDRNSKTSVMSSARFQCTVDGSKQ
ncbi:hypothetical protein Tco_1107448 [Tanacetum coccineum]